MRENGLRAAAYVAVGDLHPQVADAMLSALAEHGVAAYATPVPGSRGLLMPAAFPAGPVDRLYVDRDAQEAATQVLDAHLEEARTELEHVPPEPPTRTGDGSSDGPVDSTGDTNDVPHADGDVATLERPDGRTEEHLADDGGAASEPGGEAAEDEGRAHAVPTDGQTDAPAVRAAGDEPTARTAGRTPDHVDDDTWGQIVASFHGAPADRAWPDAEDVPPGQPSGATTTPGVVRRPLSRPAAPRADPDDQFVPPPPPPLPTADSTTRMAWVGVVGGPLLFLLALLLDWQLASWAQLAGVAALVGGFVTLVARMRDDPDDRSGDHGAIV